jgi:hypothetical protein
MLLYRPGNVYHVGREPPDSAIGGISMEESLLSG